MKIVYLGGVNSVSKNNATSLLPRADLIIVGAGLFGMTIAQQCSEEFPDFRIAIIDSRQHIGGNAHSFFDNDTGIEIHKYGSHIFHTNQDELWEYVNRFTKFNSYTHKVKAKSNGKLFTLPFNLSTFSEVYGEFLSPEQLNEIQNANKLKFGALPDNFENKAKSELGEKVYELLVEGYSSKQWQTEARLLPSSIISRIPVRRNYDDRYFTDSYQGLPLNGYEFWFKNMLQSEKIFVLLNCDYFEIKNYIPEDKIIVYTGPIDEYFDFCAGKLGWRTLDFEFETLNISDYQANSVINYCDKNVEFTRIHEFKHLHPERIPINKTVIAREYSRFSSLPSENYYPINSPQDMEILKAYRWMASSNRNIYFGGRLGAYKYLDMNMAIASALTLFRNELKEKLECRV